MDSPDTPLEPVLGDRLDSWKEIAAYLKRDVRTLHRWEIEESLPIHRHPHKKRDSVYAYRTELDVWRKERHRRLDRRGGHFVGHWNVALGELARQIAESLRLRLTPEDEKRLAKRSTQNREAYQLLLKAQYHLNKWTPEGLRQGMAYTRQAIEADPKYAEAYAWASAAYAYHGQLGIVPPAEAFPKAKAAAQKALEIDDSLAEAHYVLGFVRLFYEWDWSGAEQACKRAIELNPNFAWGHALWSDWLIVMGRQEEAMSEGHLAVELDPLSANLNVFLGLKLCWRGDYDRALEQLQKALEFDPNFGDTHVTLALTYARKGTYEESLAECEKVASLFGSSPRSRALSSLILAMAGKTDEAQKILSELKGYRKLDSLSLIPLAEACSVLGEKTKAFEFLEVAYQERAGLLIFLDAYPNFRNISTDPRYADLLRRMGLPQLRSPTSRS
jgi:tetratricopeptide (TPR) repeat protein